eukprot:6466797-Amphidinium_carterae.1
MLKPCIHHAKCGLGLRECQVHGWSFFSVHVFLARNQTLSDRGGTQISSIFLLSTQTLQNQVECEKCAPGSLLVSLPSLCACTFIVPCVAISFTQTCCMSSSYPREWWSDGESEHDDAREGGGCGGTTGAALLTEAPVAVECDVASSPALASVPLGDCAHVGLGEPLFALDHVTVTQPGGLLMWSRS